MENNNIVFLRKILLSDNVSESINQNLEQLLELIPEIKHMIGFEHNHPHHHLDVWNHVLLALENSENDFEIRLTLLLHDIGKPFSHQDEEVRHFKGHATMSSIMALFILQRIKFDPELIKRIDYLIKYHDEPILTSEINDNNRNLEIKRLKVQYADAKAHAPDKVKKRILLLDKIANEIIL